jgi:methionyl-tRNA formyltransferase
MRLFVIGSDRISKSFVHGRTLPPKTELVIDRSTNITRVFRLVYRGSLTPGVVLRMAWAEFLRPDPGPVAGLEVMSSAELTELAKERKPSEILLFRAGIIIRRDLLNLGIPIYNVHSARLPEYGGLGTISRALTDGAYDQQATLHRVNEKIDAGEVLDTEPYRLDPELSYSANEAIAYAAGMELLDRTLQRDRI